MSTPTSVRPIPEGGIGTVDNPTGDIPLNPPEYPTPIEGDFPQIHPSTNVPVTPEPEIEVAPSNEENWLQHWAEYEDSNFLARVLGWYEKGKEMRTKVEERSPEFRTKEVWAVPGGFPVSGWAILDAILRPDIHVMKLRAESAITGKPLPVGKVSPELERQLFAQAQLQTKLGMPMTIEEFNALKDKQSDLALLSKARSQDVTAGVLTIGGLAGLTYLATTGWGRALLGLGATAVLQHFGREFLAGQVGRVTGAIPVPQNPPLPAQPSPIVPEPKPIVPPPPTPTPVPPPPPPPDPTSVPPSPKIPDVKPEALTPTPGGVVVPRSFLDDMLKALALGASKGVVEVYGNRNVGEGFGGGGAAFSSKQEKKKRFKKSKRRNSTKGEANKRDRLTAAPGSGTQQMERRR